MDELMHQVATVLRGLWRRRWIGLAAAWVVAVVGAVVVARIPDRYEAAARVFVDTQTVLRPLMSGLAVQPNVDEQIAILARTLITRPNIEKIVRSTDLDSTATTQVQKDHVIDSVTKRVKFSGAGRENIYSISFNDPDPERAKKVVQDMLSLFMESGIGNKRRDSEAARRFIDEQIKHYEEKLAEGENRVKDFKIKNLAFTGAGQDYFTRMNALSEDVAKQRLELRVAVESRDALKRELAGEDPVLLPDITPASTSPQASELDVRIAAQTKLLDELMRRYTEEHPDVVATRRLIAQLEDQKKREIEARKAAVAAQKTPRYSTSTNPVFQQIKVSLAEAEANVASLRTRLEESEGRLAQLKGMAGRAPQVEAELAQLNRDYDVLRKNYEQLVTRREAASISEDVDTQGQMATFRVIDPPRISPKAVFPNRFALVPMVLALALGAGLAASFVVSQLFPTFHDARQLRAASKRPVLGSIELQPTGSVLSARKRSNVAFAGSIGSLVLGYGSWIAWMAIAGRA